MTGRDITRLCLQCDISVVIIPSVTSRHVIIWSEMCWMDVKPNTIIFYFPFISPNHYALVNIWFIYQSLTYHFSPITSSIYLIFTTKRDNGLAYCFNVFTGRWLFTRNVQTWRWQNGCTLTGLIYLSWTGNVTLFF